MPVSVLRLKTEANKERLAHISTCCFWATSAVRLVAATMTGEDLKGVGGL